MRRVTVIAAAAIAVAALLPPVQAATASMSSPTSAMPTAESTPAEATLRSITPRRSVTGRKGQSLTVTPTASLGAGQTLRVRGKGFSELVGIYVGLCVMPRPGAKPTPCGGGQDMDGSSDSSKWISSNPPPYGAKLAIPYKRGGKFSVRIRVSPFIGAFDCRRVRCAVVARADHMRANDRTWDVVVPVSFR